MRSLACLCIVIASIAANGQSPAAQSVVNVHMRLEFKTGPDAIPPNKTYVTIPRDRTVYLFDGDPSEILDKAGVKIERDESYGESHRGALLSDYLESDDAIHGSGGNYLLAFRARADKVLKSHMLRMMKTDAKGTASFANLTDGVYFIAAAAGGQHSQVWNLRIEVRSSVNITLDQNNRWQPKE
jgi:hypothetical protein